MRDDGSDPAFAFTGTLSARLDNQLTLGLSADYVPLTSRWGAFGDFSRSGGDARFHIDTCADDPDFGRECFGQSLEARGSQWRASAGVTRRFSVGATSTLTLAVGALYSSTHFEADEADAEVPDLDESSPGAILGGSIDLPLTPRLGVRLHLRDAMMRIDGSKFARELGQGAAIAGIIVESDDRIVNALNFGAGLVMRW